MSQFRKDLEQYFKKNPEGEIADRFFSLLEEEKAFYRENPKGHFTGAGFVLSPKNEILLMHHRKLDKWLQPGGHCDGNPNPVETARREVEEETGLKNLSLLSEEIFDLDIHEIPENKKEAGHFHFDVRFVFKSSDTELLLNDESNALKWFSLEEAKTVTNEPGLHRAFDKIKRYL